MDIEQEFFDLYFEEDEENEELIDFYEDLLVMLVSYTNFYYVDVVKKAVLYNYLLISFSSDKSLIFKDSFIRSKENFFFKANYKFENIIKTLITKFIRSGKRYLIERIMHKIFSKNCSFYFFFYLFEVIELLRPAFYLRILIFQRRGKQRSVKKGTKVKKRTKVIPIKINFLKSYKVSFMWLVKSILKKDSSIKAKHIIEETCTSYISKNSGAWTLKYKMYRLASKNRSNFHFRWKKIWY